MGVKESREVRTTFVCDFCKHSEILIAEISQERFPQGWSVLTLVPGDQNPRVEQMPSPDYYARDGKMRRACLSSDREINLALACPACSIYGLQAIKLKKPEEAKPLYRAPVWVFLTIAACLITVGAILGFIAGVHYLH